jgi:hypothetical protein
MTQNKLKLRKSFSSPDQLEKMAMMVMSRWEEIWPIVSHRHQLEQQHRNEQIRLSLQRHVCLPRA